MGVPRPNPYSKSYLGVILVQIENIEVDGLEMFLVVWRCWLGGGLKDFWIVFLTKIKNPSGNGPIVRTYGCVQKLGIPKWMVYNAKPY